MSSFKKVFLLGLAVFTSCFCSVHLSEALTVSPVKIELQGDPGQTLNADFRLLNEQANDLTFYASAENFEAQGEDGTPNFTSRDTGLASWITLDPLSDGSDSSIVQLKSQEEISRSFSVTIPEDAAPGGYFAALFWATTPSTQENTVAVGAKVGILIFLTVNGEVDENASLLEFDTENGSRYFEGLPVSFFYRFQNSGMDRVIPQGEIELKNILGMSSDVISVNLTQNNVLPKSIRRFDETWGTASEETGFWASVKSQWQDFAFGPYTAKLSLVYGSEKTTAEDTVKIWIFPWQLLLVSVLTIVGGSVVGTFGIRRYNHWIIEQALAHQNTKKRKK